MLREEVERCGLLSHDCQHHPRPDPLPHDARGMGPDVTSGKVAVVIIADVVRGGVEVEVAVVALVFLSPLYVYVFLSIQLSISRLVVRVWYTGKEQFQRIFSQTTISDAVVHIYPCCFDMSSKYGRYHLRTTIVITIIISSSYSNQKQIRTTSAEIVVWLKIHG